MEKNYILGIDEAGRGPVLGSLVYGCAVWEENKSQEFKKKYNLRDSKKIKEEEREKIFTEMEGNEEIHYFVEILEPDFISTEMLRRNKISLNVISLEAVYKLINKARARFNVIHGYIDTLGSPVKYKQELMKNFTGIEFTVESKADDTYPVVSAASVFAKVTRDRRLAAWSHNEDSGDKKENEIFGSGYPADPKTKAWLTKNFSPLFGFPSLVRFSWSTARKFIENNQGAKMVWEDFEDQDQNICTIKEPTNNFFQDEYDVKLSGETI